MKTLLNIIFATIAALFMVVLLWRYASVNSNEQAESPLQTHTTVSSETSTFWDFFNKAERLRKNGRFEEAAALYEKAHTLNSNHQGTLYYLGQMHLYLRHFGKARQYWQKLVRIDSTSVQAQKQLGMLHFCHDSENNLYDLKKATTHFLKVLQLNRIETFTHLKLGEIALLRDSLQKAHTYFTTVTNHDFMNYKALFLMGYIHYKQQNNPLAHKYLSKTDSVFQNMNSVTMHGEGATKAGFKPMLNEEQFCDVFEHNIDSLVSKHLNDQKHTINTDDIFQSFDRMMNTLK